MRLLGRIDCHRIESRLLAGNPLGDPTERELFVYTPPDYDAGGHYPIVMLLAGYGSTHRSLLNYDFFQPNPVERFDRLVREGRCKPALLVLPDAINRWGGSQFLDSTATGRYQSYLADEIVPFVETRYRTFAERAGRAVLGRSSGGFGALRLGLDRPEVFGAIGSHAGDSAFELSILPELRDAAIAYDRSGGLSGFLARFQETPERVSFTGLMILAYTAAYVPAPAQGFPFCELPIDVRSGTLIESAWQRLLAHDPLQRIAADEAALCDSALVYLDAGNRDEHGLCFGARRMAELLQQRGAKVHYEEFDGGHRGTGHRFEASFPRLVDACWGAGSARNSGG
jgi:enterochelin esterase-like enzyme